MYNILIACDDQYYQTWAENCIRSIHYHTSWMNVTVVIVNPSKTYNLKNVRYIYDHKEFINDQSKIAYYQAVRFLKCLDIFHEDDLIMSIDCDTVLTKSFSKNEFESICKNIHIQRHQKDIRWMAGLVTFGQKVDFRRRFKEELLAEPIENWLYGRDQYVLEKLSHEFEFKKLHVGEWMSFGRGKGTFLTLKGHQKNSEGYLNNYKENLIKAGISTNF